MTVASNISKHTYYGNGVTTLFPFSFTIFKESDIKVILTDLNGKETQLTSGWLVDVSQSAVVYPYPSGQPLTAGWRITLLRLLDIVQETSLPNQGPYFAETVEKAADRSIAIDQQQQEQLERVLKLGVSAGEDVSRDLPVPVPKGVLRWNLTGTALENTPSEEDILAKAEALALQDYTGSMRIAGVIAKDPWVDVRAFGAKGDGVTDDTQAIQEAIKYANEFGGCVLFPNGTFVISDTIIVTNREFYGCRITGMNAQGTTILSKVTETTPVFSFYGGSGGFSNIGISNMTISPIRKNSVVAIYIEGQGFGLFENLRIRNMKYGIWLHNNRNGSFSELNQFSHIQVDYCENNIRMEQGNGTVSFHGNSFDHVYMNVGANQIGFNMVSGYFYNGRFDLFMWSHDPSAIYVHAGGNVEHCMGNITYESFQPGRFTGTGRFWFNGFIRGIGGMVDETTVKTSGEMVFACTNYQSSTTLKGTSMKVHSLTGAEQRYNGQHGMLKRLTHSNIESLLGVCYSGNSDNGLYLATSAWAQAEDNANLGLFLSAFGSVIKTYNASGLSLVSADNTSALKVANGRFTGSPGIRQVIALAANAGQQTITVPLYTDTSIFCLVGMRISGSGFEYRKAYVANHQGFGGNGHITELASGYILSKQGVSLNSVSVNADGYLQIIVTTSQSLNIIVSAMGIGIF